MRRGQAASHPAVVAAVAVAAVAVAAVVVVVAAAVAVVARYRAAEYLRCYLGWR